MAIASRIKMIGKPIVLHICCGLDVDGEEMRIFNSKTNLYTVNKKIIDIENEIIGDKLIRIGNGLIGLLSNNKSIIYSVSFSNGSCGLETVLSLSTSDIIEIIAETVKRGILGESNINWYTDGNDYGYCQYLVYVRSEHILIGNLLDHRCFYVNSNKPKIVAETVTNTGITNTPLMFDYEDKKVVWFPDDFNPGRVVTANNGCKIYVRQKVDLFNKRLNRLLWKFQLRQDSVYVPMMLLDNVLYDLYGDYILTIPDKYLNKCKGKMAASWNEMPLLNIRILQDSKYVYLDGYYTNKDLICKAYYYLIKYVYKNSVDCKVPEVFKKVYYKEIKKQ